ncbi:hypothetical protein ACS0TY_029749 [Phlomoides rotata]
MIKRRFYRLDHSNRDAASGSDSSSSDSYLEPEASDESHETEIEDGDEEENVVSDVRVKGEASSSSGYESEDSSVNEVNLDSSGLPTSDDDAAAQNGVQNMLGSFADVETNSLLAGAHNSPEKDGKTDFDTADCVIKCKSVFKCRLCPRIVCLSEDTIKAHLSSKASIYIYVFLQYYIYYPGIFYCSDLDFLHPRNSVWIPFICPKMSVMVPQKYMTFFEIIRIR